MYKHIRIKFKSYNIKLIEKIITDFKKIAYKTKSSIYGPIPLPTKKERFTILTSPHVDKDARDQYEILTYKRLLGIITLNSKILNYFMKIKLISGVYVKITSIN